MHRVEELADRAEPPAAGLRTPFRHLLPLNEIVGEALGKSADCAGVWETVFRFIREFGDEHRILTEVPVDELARLQPERVARGVDRMRKGLVRITPGHDGEYGTISLFDGDEGPAEGQMSLF
jgi:PHP family Zn ribbon phosphoesterase